MMTPEQCRAARAWLDWSQQDLAARAQIGVSTVRDFEKGARSPIKNNLEAMRQAFAAAGLEMVVDEDGKAAGIKLADTGGPT